MPNRLLAPFPEGLFSPALCISQPLKQQLFLWACSLTQSSITRRRLEEQSCVTASQNEQPRSFVPSSDEELPQVQVCSRAVCALAPLSGPLASPTSFLLACSPRLLQGAKLSLLFSASSPDPSVPPILPGTRDAVIGETEPQTPQST